MLDLMVRCPRTQRRKSSLLHQTRLWYRNRGCHAMGAELFSVTCPRNTVLSTTPPVTKHDHRLQRMTVWVVVSKNVCNRFTLALKFMCNSLEIRKKDPPLAHKGELWQIYFDLWETKTATYIRVLVLYYKYIYNL